MILILFLLLIFITFLFCKTNKNTPIKNKNAILYKKNCKNIFKLNYQYILYNFKITYTNCEVVRFIGKYSRLIINLLDEMLIKIKYNFPNLNKNSNFEVLKSNNFMPYPVYKIKFINQDDFTKMINYKVVYKILNELNIQINLVCIASNNLYYKIKDMFPLVFNYDFIDYELLSNINAFNINKDGLKINNNKHICNEILVNNKTYNCINQKSRYIEFIFDKYKISRVVDLNFTCMIYSIQNLKYNKCNDIIVLPIYLPKSIYKIENISSGIILSDVYTKKQIKIQTNAIILSHNSMIKDSFSLFIKINKNTEVIIEYSYHQSLPTFENCMQTFDKIFELTIKSYDSYFDYIFNSYLRNKVIYEYINNPLVEFCNMENIYLHKEYKEINKQQLNKIYINPSFASYYYNYLFSILLGIKQCDDKILIKPSEKLWLKFWELKYTKNNKSYTIYLEENTDNTSVTCIDSTNIHNSTLIPISVLEKSCVQIKY